MIKYRLIIDTVSRAGVAVALKSFGQMVAERFWSGDRQQAEQLLPGILALLDEQGVTWPEIDGVEVVNQGGSFTSLRIGVVTANALAFALGLPTVGSSGSALSADGYQIVQPEYSGQPNITIKKASQSVKIG